MTPRHLRIGALCSIAAVMACGDTPLASEPRGLPPGSARRSLTSFNEGFSGPTLDPEWTVVSYGGTRVFGFGTPANHYSLTDRPGYLRYSLDEMTHSDGFWRGFATAPAGEVSCCAHDPGLELRRTVTGEYWRLEGKADFNLPYANGRALELRVYFGDGTPGTYGIRNARGRDVNQNWFLSLLRQQTGTTIHDLVYLETSREDVGDGSFDESAGSTYWVRVERSGGVLTASWSSDGITWTTGWTRDMGTSLNGLAQTVVVTGLSWFVPAGSYADWDYITFVPTTFPVGIDIMPGSIVNPINLKKNGVIPVAILGTTTFAPTSEVDQSTLRFGRAGTESPANHCTAVDVNGDAIVDLLCTFGAPQAGFVSGDVRGNLTGLLIGGRPIAGSDVVRIQ